MAKNGEVGECLPSIFPDPAYILLYEEQAKETVQNVEGDKAKEMMLDTVARVGAARKRMTRKVVRIPEERCNKIMSMPWPPRIPVAFSPNRCDDVKDPELREMMRRHRADAAKHLRRIHAHWAQIREQYAAHGYADVVVDVDERGREWIPDEF